MKSALSAIRLAPRLVSTFARVSDQSILLGEAAALRVLQDCASCYNEKFSITITKFDGTTATISN